MKSMGLTDRALCEQVGCTRAAITKLRLGFTRPSMDMAKKLSEHTGLSLDKLAEIKVTKRKENV
jgi:transcriptional regulator with XRE-family HTH domain